MKCIATFFGSLLLLASTGPSAAEVQLGPGVAEAINMDGEARVLVWVGAAVAEPERAAELVDAVLEQQPSLTLPLKSVSHSRLHALAWRA